MFEQELCDIAPSHVGSASQSRFEISLAPIDGPVDERGIRRDHLFHGLQIEMARDDESFHPRSIDLRVVFRKIRHDVG